MYSAPVVLLPTELKSEIMSHLANMTTVVCSQDAVDGAQNFRTNYASSMRGKEGSAEQGKCNAFNGWRYSFAWTRVAVPAWCRSGSRL
ncbi:hypothetical protein E4U25_007284 [Claviceps purpurea]|nr:hypothetical protein E4U25_007284 [Claviceps purpurea]